MTLSELCIRRPVMTTLMTASIIAFGVFGFRLLPVSALPKVDFPTIAVTATLPGASADTMASSVAGHRTPALDDRRHLVDVVDLLAGHHRDHHPVRSQPQHRRRRARRADRADHRAAPVADRDDDPAEFPQGESVGFRGAVHLAGLGDAAAVGGQRIWRHHHRAGAVADSGRRPGRDLRQPEIRDPGAGRSGSRGGARTVARRHPHRGLARQFVDAGRHAERTEAGRRAAGLRPDGQGDRLPPRDRRLAQRFAGQARRGRAHL